MEWISTEKQLPPRVEVLFYVKELDQIELGKYNEITKKWMVPHSDIYFYTGNNFVTHWCYLPKLPEET